MYNFHLKYVFFYMYSYNKKSVSYLLKIIKIDYQIFKQKISYIIELLINIIDIF